METVKFTTHSSLCEEYHSIVLHLSTRKKHIIPTVSIEGLISVNGLTGPSS